MKIKAVCEATGLTDRAVRYYIEEGLIEPDFTENYLGRRNYEFDEEDVRALCSIATLRRYGFSVSDILTIKTRPEEIATICKALIERKRAGISQDSAALESLERSLERCPTTLDELAAALALPAAPVPAEDSSRRISKRIGGVLLVIACILPLSLAAVMVYMACSDYRYPVFNTISAIVFFAALAPSVLGLTVPALIKNGKARFIVKAVLAGDCLACLPVIFISGLLLVFRSETDKPENYLFMDDRCLAYDSFFFELFPSRTVFLLNDTENTYHYSDYEDLFMKKTEVFTEMKLSADEFDKEIVNKKVGFDSYYKEYSAKWSVNWSGSGSEDGMLEYGEFRRGRFSCIAFYTYGEPFEDCHQRRSIYLFAYDPEDCTVRYAFYNCNDDCNDLPYFTSLDWGIG